MCPSEVSDIEHSIWRRYKDQGVQVFGIGSEDSLSALTNFRDSFGLTYPILYYANGQVHAKWNLQSAFPTAAYPQDWIVGPDGRIVYANNGFEPDEMRFVLERYLED